MSYFIVVRPAFCGHYTETIEFGPFKTRKEAASFSQNSGKFGAEDFIDERGAKAEEQS